MTTILSLTRRGGMLMRIKAVAIGLGAVALSAGAGVWGLGFYASRHAEKWAALVLDQLPPGIEASHGKASCDWLCNPLVIEDVALAADLPWAKHIHIARITVAGMKGGLWDALRGRLPDAVGARSVVLDGIEYDSQGGVHQSIERTELVEPHLDRRFDRQGKPWSMAEWLQVFSLTSAQATNLRGVSGGDLFAFETHAEKRTISGM